MKLYLIIIFLFNISLLFGQSRIEETIYFSVDSYELSDQEGDKLKSLLHRIKDYDILEIHLSGHTDSDGSFGYNHKLSIKRANEIRDLFIQKGFSIDQKKIIYNGELKPKSINISKDDKKKNRRVEILIIYNEEKLHSQFYIDTEIQKYEFDGIEGIELSGKMGTKIKINPNSIVDSVGKYIEGRIELELKEYYLNSDIIFSGLQTLSIEDSLLETAGMIHLKVLQNELELDLKKGETIEIIIPNKKRLKSMDFYDKEENENKWEKATPWVWEPQMKDMILDEFIFKSPKFGWINCDRFLDFEELTELYVEVNDTIGTRVCIVFKSIYTSPQNLSQ